MPKECDKCGRPHKGFGTTCASCRKLGAKAGAGGVPHDCERCGNFFIGFGELCPDCVGGKGPGRTGVKLPTCEEVDKCLDKIDTCLKKVDVSQDSMVKLRKAELDLLGQLELVRDLMQRILKSGDRVLLRKTLVDCGRVARLRAYVDSVHLTEQNVKDQRYRTCEGMITSVEEMVETMGLTAQLEEAQKETDKNLLMARLSVVMDTSKAKEFEVEMTEVEMRKYGQHVDIDPLADSDDDDMDDEELDDYDEAQHFEIFTQNVRRLFDELDADGNGKLTRDEVRNASAGLAGVLKACRIYKRKHIVKLFKEGDIDGDGTLDFDEFLNYIVAAQERAYYAQQPKIDDRTVRMIFETMDKDGDGSITCEELKLAYAGILLRAGEKVDPKRVGNWAKRNFKKYDTDGSQALDYQEFKSLVEHSGALAPLVDSIKGRGTKKE